MRVCSLVNGDSKHASSRAGHPSGDRQAAGRSTSQARTPRTIIVGLGSDIACDDGVGILAARRLGHLLRSRPNVDVMELPWAGLHLLTALRGYERAILVDSLRSQRHRPGTVVRLVEQDLGGSVRLNSFHDLNYPTAMALGRKLGWPMPAQIVIYAVEGRVFGRFGTELTPAVARGLDRVVELVACLCVTGKETASRR